MGFGPNFYVFALFFDFFYYQAERKKMNLENMQCPGCDKKLSEVQLGGYRSYCITCTDSFPPLPECGGQPAGKYPNLYWIPAKKNSEE